MKTTVSFAKDRRSYFFYQIIKSKLKRQKEKVILCAIIVDAVNGHCENKGKHL
jgi:hypothetical protein